MLGVSFSYPKGNLMNREYTEKFLAYAFAVSDGVYVSGDYLMNLSRMNYLFTPELETQGIGVIGRLYYMVFHYRMKFFVVVEDNSGEHSTYTCVAFNDSGGDMMTVPFSTVEELVSTVVRDMSDGNILDFFFKDGGV